MNPIPFDKLQPGDFLFDMHYAFKGIYPLIAEGAEVVHHASFRSEQGKAAIESSVRQWLNRPWTYTNKYLVVVDVRSDTREVVAAYSYDGMRFGLVTLKVNEPRPPG